MKVAIIGAGIAGLTMAIALKRANIPFVIYEATKEIKPVGAGIAIANNAMQVYRYLGVADQLNERGVRISTVKLTDFKLNLLNSTDLTPYEQRYKLANIAIHRSELHQVLLNAIDRENVVLGKRIQYIEKRADGLYELMFTDNNKATHEYVIGADGIRSQVREFIFGDHPLRDAKQVCWRGVLDFDLPPTHNHVAREGWGKGKRFGFVKLDSKQVYWYFLVDEDKYIKQPELKDHLGDCAPLVAQMITQTPPSELHIDKIYDLQLMQQWYKDKVCLIGDAAHATTPNLGQGACQTIEDVYVFSRLLEKFTLDEALQKFPVIRRKKAHSIVRNSWQLGQIAQLSNPLVVAARNTAFKVLPAFLKDKQMKEMFELDKVY